MMLSSNKSFLVQEIAKVRAFLYFRLQSRRALLMRLAIIGGMLVATPIVGVLAARLDPILILFIAVAPLTLVGLRFWIDRPYLAPVIILAAATATTWYFSKGITPALVLTALFIGAWLVKQMVLKHRLELIKSPVMAPALAFIMVTVISLFWSKATADPLLINWPGFDLIQLAQLAVLVLSPGTLILTANLITTKQHLQWLFYAFIGLTTIEIIADVTRLPLRLNIGGLISTWAVSLMYGQLLFNRKLPNRSRLAFSAVICLWLYRGLYLGITWLSGWFPVVISVCVITFLRSRKLFLVLLVLLLILIIALYPWWQQVVSDEQASSGDSRTSKWEFLLAPDTHSTWGHWLLGTGPFGYALYFMTYFPDNSASTHSNYIDIFLQMGVVGCIIFVWLLGAIARVGYGLNKTPISDGFIAGFTRSALGGLVAVIVAMALGDWFTPFVLNQGLHGFSWTVNSWIFLGALVAVPFIIRQEEGSLEGVS